MQTTQKTAEQYSETAATLLQHLESPDANAAPNFSWPATVKLQNTIQICCASQPPTKGTTDVTSPLGGSSSGTCQFRVPASELPVLGELTIEVNIALGVISIAFFNGTTVIGVYAGNGGVAPSVLGGHCKFEFGAC